MKNPHAVALGRMTSPAKAEASRLNGKKGGRPKKITVVEKDKTPVCTNCGKDNEWESFICLYSHDDPCDVVPIYPERAKENNAAPQAGLEVQNAGE